MIDVSDCVTLLAIRMITGLGRWPFVPVVFLGADLEELVLFAGVGEHGGHAHLDQRVERFVRISLVMVSNVSADLQPRQWWLIATRQWSLLVAHHSRPSRGLGSTVWVGPGRRAGRRGGMLALARGEPIGVCP